jgi:PAS domain S-box-containing protein
LNRIARLRDWWDRLTTPLIPIDDPLEYRKARLIASIQLFTLIVVFASTIPAFITEYTVDDFGWRVLWRVGSFGLYAYGYWMSRTGRHMASLNYLLITGAVTVTIYAGILGGAYGLFTMSFIAICTISGTFFLSQRNAFLNQLLYSVLMIVYAVVIYDGPVAVGLNPLFLLWMVYIFVLMAVRYLRRIESYNRAKLEESERDYRVLFESIEDIVYTIDRNAYIRTLNPSAFSHMGWPPSEMIGKSFQEFIHPEDLGKLIVEFAGLMQGQKESRVEARARHADHTFHLYDFRSWPLYSSEGEPVGVSGVARDITQERDEAARKMQITLMQEQLGIVQRLMGAVSHDFRNSLSQIETSRYLVGKTLTGDGHERAHIRLESIGLSVKHMTGQIENLTTLSGIGELNVSRLDIPAVLDPLLKEAAPALDKKSIVLEPEYAPRLPAITGDVEKIRVVLNHLLENAITHTPEQGLIRVTVVHAGSMIRISISDTGPGIAPEHLEHIFDLFYRVDAARSINQGGIGLGLSLARLVAEAHGGSLTVRSMVGSGSTFTIALPVTLSGAALGVQMKGVDSAGG